MSNRNILAAATLVATLAATGLAFAQAPAANGNAAAQAKAKQATPETIFNDWDKDKNKSLSIDEFRTGWAQITQQIQARQVVAKLHQNFTAMDKDKSGALDQNEFANLELIKKAGSKAPMMSAFDADKNGKLEFKEYVSLVETMMRNTNK
jgi:Ca2+-binding EF-hand superfamily protein